MKVHKIGIIMNGVTGRMGTNQHLIRSIKAIIDQGGVKLSDSEVILPDPVLVGRSEEKLKALAARTGVSRVSTNLDAELAKPENQIYFDATLTGQRPIGVRKAIAAKKHIYCEKPTGVTTEEALSLARRAEAAGVKNGVVQDKLWLPGLRKFQLLRDQGFFGTILSVRGEFGYWVFTGEHEGQPAQRPSWNYRREDGGGIILDMLCHWRYVVDNCFGPVKSVSCLGATHIPSRVDEKGQTYTADADDAAYATFQLAGGVVAHINSSWDVRVRRDDLVTFQVDGTHGSAVAGLHKCFTQHRVNTPKPVWNPDEPSKFNFFEQWEEVPNNVPADNGFKAQWEMFLKHVVDDAPWAYGLEAGAKGVQLAALGLQSWKERRWLDVPALGI